MKKYLLFLIIPFLMGMTSEEAKQLYIDLECQIISTETCEKGVSCKGLFDVALYHDASWDEPEPNPTVCIPTWCSLELQDCSIETPLTGGTDSCGEPCSKPSPEWPNCLLDGKKVAKDFN